MTNFNEEEKRKSEEQKNVELKDEDLEEVSGGAVYAEGGPICVECGSYSVKVINWRDSTAYCYKCKRNVKTKL
jgi:formamidopyrimidine-DNA glycosylase